MTKTIAQHAAEHLKETGNPAVMYGDVHLIHEILERAGRPHRGYKSCGLFLNALENSPLFEKKIVLIGNRGVRRFDLRKPKRSGART